MTPSQKARNQLQRPIVTASAAAVVCRGVVSVGSAAAAHTCRQDLTPTALSAMVEKKVGEGKEVSTADLKSFE